MATTALDRLRAAKRETREYLSKMRGLGSRGKHIATDAIRAHTKSLDRTERSMGPYRNPSHFMRDVALHGAGGTVSENMQKYDREYREYREKAVRDYGTKAFASSMQESILSEGGVLIPAQWSNEILMRVYQNDLLSRCRLFQLAGNVLNIPAIDETSRANGSRFGGIAAYWRQEGPPAALTTSRPKENNVEIKLETLYVFSTSTTEFQEDYPAAQSFLSDIVAQEFNFKIGDALVNGDGVGKPRGLLQSGSLKSIAKDSGQAAGTISVDNVLNMYTGMWVGSRPNGVWLVCNRAWPQLMKMVIGTYPIFIPNSNIAGKPFPTLLGNPIIETEFNADLGTIGDIIFFDPTTILVGTKGDVRSFSSMHVYFDRGLNAFRFEMRIDAKSWWKTALTMFKGSSNTTSNILAVATRS